MKKLCNWKRILAMGLALVMTLSMAGCDNAKGKDKEGGKNGKGDKTVEADSSLAKQYVYRYQDLKLGDLDGKEINLNGTRKTSDRVELICTVYSYENGEGQTVKLISMKHDGSDVKITDLERKDIVSEGSE